MSLGWVVSHEEFDEMIGEMVDLKAEEDKAAGDDGSRRRRINK